jgi:hypothetical protein
MVYKYVYMHRCTRDNVIYTRIEGSPFKVLNRNRKKPSCPMTKQVQFLHYEFGTPQDQDQGPNNTAHFCHLVIYVYLQCGPGSVVGIATGLGRDRPGMESRACPDRPWGAPSLLYNGHRVFPGGKERPRRDAEPSPPSRAVVKKG